MTGLLLKCSVLAQWIRSFVGFNNIYVFFRISYESLFSYSVVVCAMRMLSNS